jgi:hypothetical protein
MPGWKQKGQNGLQNKERTRAVRQLRQWFSALKTKKTAPRTGTLGERMKGDNLDNSGQLFQGAPPNRAAAVKKGPSNRRLGGATFQSRPSGWSVGGRGKGGLQNYAPPASPSTFRPQGGTATSSPVFARAVTSVKKGRGRIPAGSTGSLPVQEEGTGKLPVLPVPLVWPLGTFHPAATQRGPPGKPGENAGCRIRFPRGHRCGICLALEGACGYSPGASGAVSHPGETPGGNGVPSSIIQLNP